MTLREVAERLDWSAPTLSRIENGMRDSTPEEIAALLVVYKVTGAKHGYLVNLARTIDQPGWWATSSTGLAGQLIALCAFEAEATKFTEFRMNVVPGILQTEAYARALMEAMSVPDHLANDMVSVRLGRQEILSRRNRPELHAIIDQSVLHRPLGGRSIMADQLRHLITQSARPDSTIQVLREPGHGALDGSYIILEFPPPAKPMVHLEHLRSSMFLDEDEDVQVFQDTTATIARKALDPATTREYLAHLAHRYESEARRR